MFCSSNFLKSAVGLIFFTGLPITSFADNFNLLGAPTPSPFYITASGGMAFEHAGQWQRVNSANGDEATQYPINQPSSEDEDVSLFGGAIGYAFSNVPVRVELAYNYFGQSTYKWNRLLAKTDDWTQVGKATINTQVALLNAYYDINTNTNWTPYLTAGIGYATNQVQFSYATTDSRSPDHTTYTSKDKNTTNFAWTVGTGVNYAITQNLSLGVGINYIDLGDADVQYSVNNSNQPYAKLDGLDAITTTINLTYRFG